MINQKIRNIGAAVLLTLWAVLTAWAWFGPAKDISEAERRPLKQFPATSLQTVLSGSFMGEFEKYTLDQFPLRDSFRQIKALFHYNALQQKDNNGIYIVDGYAAEMEYPMNQKSVDRAMRQYNKIYEKLLKDTNVKIYNTVVPDKGYYLAKQNGYLALDYEEMFSLIRSQTPWASWTDITDCLTLEDYYYTDTHWRQEKILKVAQRLITAMQINHSNADQIDSILPQGEDFTQETMERPFYGVYYGQAALPMDPEPMILMHSDIIDNATLYDFATQKTYPLYDPAMLTEKDQYNIYLRGPQSLLTITNPNATTDRELIIFRDSFGSSLAPLLLHSYKSITLVDIRYFRMVEQLGNIIAFDDQDVLFMYSALVLNKSLI